MLNVPGNTLRYTLGDQYVTAVRHELERQLTRPLSDYEMGIISREIASEDPRRYADYPQEAYSALVRRLYWVITRRCDDEPIDTHEIQKAMISGEAAPDESPSLQSISVDNLLGFTSLGDLARRYIPGQNTKTVSFVLDSRYRSLSTDGSVQFQWIFNNSENVTDDSVNVVGNVRDIISMKICPIRIPYTKYADNAYKRITLFIQEMSSQSVINHETSRHHFMFRPKVDGRFIELTTENFNDGTFEFRTPFTKLERFTISFGAPLAPVAFDPDRATATVTNYGVVTTFTTGIIPHNLETGDTVYVYTFTTLNPNPDIALIQEMINSAGQVATVVDPVTFTLDVATEVLFLVGGGTINVTHLSSTITGFGTTFTSLFYSGDNIQILGVKYGVLKVSSDTSLTLSTPYLGITAFGIPYFRNNAIPGYTTTVFFGSKRFFVPLELKYLATEETTTSGVFE